MKPRSLMQYISLLQIEIKSVKKPLAAIIQTRNNLQFRLLAVGKARSRVCLQ